MPGLVGFPAENMRKMRLFYEVWADVFEIRSAPNELGMTPLSSDIQPFIFCSAVRSKI
jgi:hypothetical protein